MRKKRGQGVRKGYRHKWFYRGKWNETKIGKGLWKIRFIASKGRKRPAGFHPNAPGIGTKIKWGIRAVQTARKVGRNTYMTDMKGTKRLLGIKHKKYRRR